MGFQNLMFKSSKLVAELLYFFLFFYGVSKFDVQFFFLFSFFFFIFSLFFILYSLFFILYSLFPEVGDFFIFGSESSHIQDAILTASTDFCPIPTILYSLFPEVGV